MSQNAEHCMHRVNSYLLVHLCLADMNCRRHHASYDLPNVCLIGAQSLLHRAPAHGQHTLTDFLLCTRDQKVSAVQPPAEQLL